MIGNSSGSGVGTEGGLDRVGSMVGPEESKPEPVVSNDSIMRVGNRDTQGLARGLAMLRLAQGEWLSRRATH